MTESEQAPELYPLTKISLISKRTHGCLGLTDGAMEGEDRDTREVVIAPMANSCTNANDVVNDGLRLIHIDIFIHRIRLLVTGTINIFTRYGG